jgi:hypothetical protein
VSVKVLWLGAGASISAGYPDTARLLGEIGALAESPGADCATREAWVRFRDYRDNAEGVEGTVLRSPNPEVALTLPDLYAAALNADDEDVERETDRAVERWKRGELGPNEATALGNRFEARYAAMLRDPLKLARARRRDFVAVLDRYFSFRHWDDARSDAARRTDLRRELEWLGSGDVVVTTNWDTTVERTLIEEGRWTPADGYGFAVDLIDGPRLERGEERELPDWVPSTSSVRVLKLHGSFGWRVDREDYGARDVVLDYEEFLASLPFSRSGEFAFARDRRASRFYDASRTPFFVVPSYLKPIAGATMQRVWHEAGRALATAHELRIVGASLPASDVAVRVLLNQVRFRLADGELAVAIHNPDPRSHDRWREFLGPAVVAHTLRAGQSDDHE